MNFGPAWSGEARSVLRLFPGSARRGEGRPGAARNGMAWRGEGFTNFFRGAAGSGRAVLGSVWSGSVGPGRAGQGKGSYR